MYKFYYINLDRRPDRRREMELQLVDYDYKRISAVDSRFINTPYKDEIKKNVIARYLSHDKVISKILLNTHNTPYIVLEDDVIITSIDQYMPRMLCENMKAYVIDKEFLLTNNIRDFLELSAHLNPTQSPDQSPNPPFPFTQNTESLGDISCDTLTIYDDYIFNKGRDSYGNDIVWHRQKTERELIELANDDPLCVCFNTYGFLKHTVNDNELFVYLNEPLFGLYVKRSHYLSKFYNKFLSNKYQYDNFLIRPIKYDPDPTYDYIKEQLKITKNLKSEIDKMPKETSYLDGISIVMTTHERITQTLFTLETIKTQHFPNLQVILIDDSSTFIDESLFTFSIDYVKILDKKWINPCINYAIGFKLVKYSKVIIQNAEVCHVGDVLKYVYENLTSDNYLVFNVACVPDLEANEPLYGVEWEYKKVYKHVLENKYDWYQHHIELNKKYHFLTAITKKNLEKLGGFDIDYTMGSCFDDNDFIYRIENVLQLNIHCVKGERMGIHLFHERSKNLAYNYGFVFTVNNYIFKLKTTWYEKLLRNRKVTENSTTTPSAPLPWLNLHECNDERLMMIFKTFQKIFLGE